MFKFWKARNFDCSKAAADLQSYLDGEIGAETASKISSHLRQCVGCKTEAVKFERIKLALQRQNAPVNAEIIENLQQFASNIADPNQA